MSGEEVLAFVSPATAREAVRDAFRQHVAGGVESPTRLVLGNGRLLVMAARGSADGSAIVKALRVDAHGERESTSARGIDGLVLWMGSGDDPVLAVEAGALTALRTAAVCAVATELLAVPDARSMAVLGAGRQVREQIRAVADVRPLRRVRIWNRTPDRAWALRAALVDAFPKIAFEVATQAAAALVDADVVCCATAAVAPLFEADALLPHAHVNAIGSYRPDMAELPRDLLTRASLVAVDDRAACLTEAGEIMSAVADGAIAAERLTELARLIAVPPRRRGITVFKTVGLAFADLAVAGALATALGDGAGAS